MHTSQCGTKLFLALPLLDLEPLDNVPTGPFHPVQVYINSEELMITPAERDPPLTSATRSARFPRLRSNRSAHIYTEEARLPAIARSPLIHLAIEPGSGGLDRGR